MTKNILVLVEGQTEERFIKNVIYHYLVARDIYIIPKIHTTKLIKAGPNFKGGITSYHKVRREVLELLGDTSAKLVTTMIDLYGLSSDFPGMDQNLSHNPYDKVRYLEKQFEHDVNDLRFKPYFSLFEFEAMLFSSPETVANTLLVPDLAEQLQGIRRQFNTPEEINDGATTAPSKRITSLINKYDKPLYGPLCTERIGLAKIRQECPHFDSWLSFLENV
jgi:hypothetical protein